MQLAFKFAVLLVVIYIVPVYMASTWFINRRKNWIKVWYNSSSKVLRRVVAACPSLTGPTCSFAPTPWLFNGHLQTLWTGCDKTAPTITYKRQVLDTPDGGKSALDWAVAGDGVPALQPPADERPVLLLVPGLTGTSNAAYVRRTAAGALARGWACVVLNHRGLGGEALASPHVYSAGFTGDLQRAVHVVRKQVAQRAPILLGGFSLGGNVAAKYLGETGKDSSIQAAFTVCQPFDLVACDQHMRAGPLNQHFYSAGMAAHLRRAVSQHDLVHLSKANIEAAHDARTVRDFDRAFTVPMFGYRSTDHYYRDASSTRLLHQVAVPLLCLNADDDPIIPSTALPYEDAEAARHVLLAVTALGGHVAHFEGWTSPKPWWLEPTFQFLEAVLADLGG